MTLDEIRASLQDLERVVSFEVGEKGKKINFPPSELVTFHFLVIHDNLHIST